MRTWAIILFSIFLCSASEARTPSNAGARFNSESGFKDYCIKVQDESGEVVNDKCLPLKVSDDFLTNEGSYFLLRANVGGTSGTSMTTSDTAVSIAFKYIRKAIASDPAFSAGTLADGLAGQMITIEITEVQASGTWTLTPATATGFTSLVFESAGDAVTILYVNDVFGWIVVSQGSVQKVN